MPPSARAVSSEREWGHDEWHDERVKGAQNGVEARGCETCDMTGYHGRNAFELLLLPKGCPARLKTVLF